MKLLVLVSLILASAAVACYSRPVTATDKSPAKCLKELLTDLAATTRRGGQGVVLFSSTEDSVVPQQQVSTGVAQVSGVAVYATERLSSRKQTFTSDQEPASRRSKRSVREGNKSKKSSSNRRFTTTIKKHMKQLKKMKCVPRREKVYVRDYLKDESLDSDIFLPEVLAVKRCCAACSFCGKESDYTASEYGKNCTPAITIKRNFTIFFYDNERRNLTLTLDVDTKCHCT